MYTLVLSHRDVQACAAALAESARKRTRDQKEAGSASRAIARRLSEAYSLAVARGTVSLDLPDGEFDALDSALLSASAGPLWYGSRTAVPQASFLRLSERFAALCPEA